MKSVMQHEQHYIRFAIMVLLSFCSMYVFMYAMVNVFGNVYPNLNQTYMAGLMTAPMVAFELVLMGSMYPNKRLNIGIIAASMIALALFWVGVRQQAAITDGQFLRSMIPHHAGAILMCEQAPIGDPEIKKLCNNIILSQQAEIDQMKAILQRLNK